jgi:hypothetical protein
MISGQPCGNFSQGDNGKTRDKVAAYTGTSGKTLEKAIKVVASVSKGDAVLPVPLFLKKY